MLWYVAPAFFIIALVYSSVGFGGGSMYLAILSFTSLSQDSLRVAALICNSLVTAAGSWHFLRQSTSIHRRMIPLMLCSTPTCIMASLIKFSDLVFFAILGIALIVAGLLMLIKMKNTKPESPKNTWKFMALSSIIGALAGITGIGGGVYLAPFLTLRSWGTAKEISAACALFILVNSVASLIVRGVVSEVNIPHEFFTLFILASIGGYLGSFISSKKWNNDRIQKMTGIILIIAGIRILLR
jgi:uncharacterized membrane protein YfcA